MARVSAFVGPRGLSWGGSALGASIVVGSGIARFRSVRAGLGGLATVVPASVWLMPRPRLPSLFLCGDGERDDDDMNVLRRLESEPAMLVRPVLSTGSGSSILATSSTRTSGPTSEPSSIQGGESLESMLSFFLLQDSGRSTKEFFLVRRLVADAPFSWAATCWSDGLAVVLLSLLIAAACSTTTGSTLFLCSSLSVMLLQPPSRKRLVWKSGLVSNVGSWKGGTSNEGKSYAEVVFKPRLLALLAVERL